MDSRDTGSQNMSALKAACTQSDQGKIGFQHRAHCCGRGLQTEPGVVLDRSREKVLVETCCCVVFAGFGSILHHSVFRHMTSVSCCILS